MDGKMFNPLTGDISSSEYDGVWYYVIHDSDIREYQWYPMYDAWGEYVGAVLEGVYVDKSNMPGELVERGWEWDVIQASRGEK